MSEQKNNTLNLIARIVITLSKDQEVLSIFSNIYSNINKKEINKNYKQITEDSKLKQKELLKSISVLSAKRRGLLFEAIVSMKKHYVSLLSSYDLYKYHSIEKSDSRSRYIYLVINYLEILCCFR
jgi:cytoplasmic iron level regulating protein YaaA (DUF328/UPF0246 family)